MDLHGSIRASLDPGRAIRASASRGKTSVNRDARARARVVRWRADMNRTSILSPLRRRIVLSNLALALPFVAACSGGPGADEGVDNRGDAIKPTYGVDYAWARPSPSHLKAEGYTFVCRYLSYDTTGKNLSLGEEASLKKAGLDIVLNWEWGAADALDGYSRGVEEAKAAEAQAKALGQPSDRPIYFSIDFDATPGDQAALDAYFDGVASVIGRARTGAYGGYYPIQRLFDHGKVKWAWQTYAWSGGQWDSRAQLRQIENGIEGGGLDKDEAVAADFGQFPHAAAPPPAPAHGGSGSLGGSVAAEPAVSANADGRLEVFAINKAGALETIFQTAPNGGWSGWFSLGGDLEGRPAAVQNEDGRIEVFARSPAGSLEHAWQDAPNGKIGSFASLGGSWTSNPAVARNHDGRLEAFAVAADGSVHHTSQTTPNGEWSGWSSLGSAGGGLLEPAAILGHGGGLYVFATGKDGATFMSHQDTGGWSAWASLGGDATSDVTVAMNGDGRLEIFVRGTDAALWHRWEESPGGAWSGWASLGGSVHQPFATSDANGQLEVFVAGNGSGPLYRIAQKTPGGGWDSWTGMGGEVAGRPVAARNKDGRLEVFYRATSGAVEHAWEGAPEEW
jgi:hypothetical protein